MSFPMSLKPGPLARSPTGASPELGRVSLTRIASHADSPEASTDSVSTGVVFQLSVIHKKKVRCAFGF